MKPKKNSSPFHAKKRPPSPQRENALEAKAPESPWEEKLFQDISSMIEEARHKTVAHVNREMVALYWHIGKRIKQDLLKNQKAEYGKQVIKSLGLRLTLIYGKGFSIPNLFRMVQFVEVFSNDKILQTVSVKSSETRTATDVSSNDNIFATLSPKLREAPTPPKAFSNDKNASTKSHEIQNTIEFGSNDNIFSTVLRKLSWSHFLQLIPIQDDLKRSFYLEMCAYEGWSVRVLRDRIRSMLYERTMISRKPEETIRQDLAALHRKEKISPALVLHDPYKLHAIRAEAAFSLKARMP